MENVKAIKEFFPGLDYCGVKGERRGKHTAWMFGLGFRMADGSNHCDRRMGVG